MKKYLSLLISFFPVFIGAQTLLIDKTDAEYLINEKILSAKNKTCRIINLISKEFISYSDRSFKPLIVIKIFGDEGKKAIGSLKQPKAIKLKEYVSSNVLPKLQADMLLRIDGLESLFTGSNTNTFDSLVLYDGNNYQYISGIVLAEFFNLSNFQQATPLQSNQTILNTKALIVPIYSWVQDSLPIPEVDAMIDGKIFLFKKEGNDYTFFRHPFYCSDCPLTFYNEYVYRDGYGVIAFKSKYLFRRTGEYDMEKIGESNEYYYFK